MNSLLPITYWDRFSANFKYYSIISEVAFWWDIPFNEKNPHPKKIRYPRELAKISNARGNKVPNLKNPELPGIKIPRF